MDDSYGLAELHEQLLIIMDDIDRVCRAHDIQYTLSDGTLLGAIRHKGFIPWDDDLDVRMVRGEFEKFKKYYKKEKREGFVIGHVANMATYSVINPDYDIPNVEKIGGVIYHPWITILPMDNAPKNKLYAKIKATILRALSGMMGKPPQYPIFSDKTRKMWDITDSIGKIIGYNRASKWYKKLCLSDNKRDTGFYASYTTNTKWIVLRYENYIFDSIEDISFEDRRYMGLVNFDEYLSKMYGDYMTPIAEKYRDTSHVGKSKNQNNWHDSIDIYKRI